ncbi:MAG: hypothetical protein EBR82_11555 [Caulobacteraceae bacterium]|nr:hypothetical protein [Caulobacteraceae bacterium]
MTDATTTAAPTSTTADSAAVPASTTPAANTNVTTEGTLLSSAPTSATDAPAPESVDRPDWLPEKFWRNDKADVESLAKSYQGLEQLLGKKANAIVPPNEKSTPEEVATYRKAIGVPESPEGYNLKPEQLPEGVTWDDNVAKKAAELAHKHNVPAAAMQEFMKFDMERAALMNQAAANMIEQQLEAGRAELQKVYGDKMPEKIELARRAAVTAGVDPTSQGFVDPQVVKAIVSLAEKLSDDKLVAGDQTGASSTRSRARDIMTNQANPLYARYQEGDPEVVDQVRRMLTSAG